MNIITEIQKILYFYSLPFLGQRAQFKQNIGVGSIFVTHFLYHNANLCEKNWVFVIFLQYHPLCYLNVEFLLISF